MDKFKKDLELPIKKKLGYEKLIMNHINHYYSQELANLFTNLISLDFNMKINEKNELNNIIKRDLTHELISYLKGVKEKNEIEFPFEIKLKPFFDKVNEFYQQIRL